MSSDEPMLPWETARTAQRKRAALGLGALAVVALLVVAGALLLFNHSGGANPVAQTTPSEPVSTSKSTPPPTATSSTPRAPTTSRSAPRTTAPKPSRPAVVLTCRARPTCVLPGDPGGAMRAVNAFRTSHGRKAVPGTATRAAQHCAANSGDTSACPQSYFWEPVTGHNGADVVHKIAQKSDGSQFLLDPRLTSIQVGWAYHPGAGGYECAIVNVY